SQNFEETKLEGAIAYIIRQVREMPRLIRKLYMFLSIMVSEGPGIETKSKVEVEPSGKVRYKNLVDLIGYCVEGTRSYISSSCDRLAYLHEESEPKVVHCDVKSISSFGLAKLLGPEKSYMTTKVMGTFKFICISCPEHARTGMLNKGTDVYSFGVLLVELIQGRCLVDYSRSAREGLVVLLDKKGMAQYTKLSCTMGSGAHWMC
ncbi:unnamed protein product, partial [Thlaspi arvense]